MSRLSYSARKLGQVYLEDEKTARYEVDLLELKPGESVLEIGPGNGEITNFLLEREATVTAVEPDSLSVEFLANKFETQVEEEKLELINGSFLDFPPNRFSAIVGNIPYNITSDILFRLNDFEFERAVIMIQKEVADRTVAMPGSHDYSRLSVNCYLRYDIEKKRDVPAAFFHPVPAVDSSIILIRKKKILDPESLQGIDAVLSRAFSMRRKKLNNIFRDCPERFRNLRPENLSPENFIELWKELG